jgi:hypothetical protein
VQDVAEQLDSLHEPRAGTRKRRRRVHRDDAFGAERVELVAVGVRLRECLVGVEAARHRDDDVGLRGRDL